MNILHICYLDNDKASGVSVIVPQYALSQVKNNNVYILNVSNIISEPIEGVEIFTRKRSLEEIISKNNIEIAVFHGIYFKEYIKYYKILKKNNIPYVVVPHVSLHENAQKQKRIPKIILNRLFYNSFIYNSSMIQYLSESEKKASAKFSHKSCIIPNGIFISDKYIWKPMEEECFDFIFIGRYAIFHKGLDILVEACEEIQYFMRKNKIRVNLYGVDFEGDLKKLNEMIYKKKLADIILIHDGVYGNEKYQKMVGADCFIQTSRMEGQPVGIIEALSVGLVSIVTEGTTFAEFVEKEKCGYNAGTTTHSVAETMKKVYNEKEKLQEKSISARKSIKNNFSWNIVSKKMQKMYREVIDQYIK